MFTIPQRFGEDGIQSNGKWSTAQMLNLTRIKQRIYHELTTRMMRSDFQNRSRYILKSKLLKPDNPVKSCPETPVKSCIHLDNLVKSRSKLSCLDNLVKSRPKLARPKSARADNPDKSHQIKSHLDNPVKLRSRGCKSHPEQYS